MKLRVLAAGALATMVMTFAGIAAAEKAPVEAAAAPAAIGAKHDERAGHRPPPGPENFAERKQMLLKKIDKGISEKEELKLCVSKADSQESLRSCMPKQLRERGQGPKPGHKGGHEGRHQSVDITH